MYDPLPSPKHELFPVMLPLRGMIRGDARARPKHIRGILPIISSPSLRYQLQHYSDICGSGVPTTPRIPALQCQFRFPLEQPNQIIIPNFLCWNCRSYLVSLSICPSSTRHAYSGHSSNSFRPPDARHFLGVSISLMLSVRPSHSLCFCRKHGAFPTASSSTMAPIFVAQPQLYLLNGVKPFQWIWPQ